MAYRVYKKDNLGYVYDVSDSKRGEATPKKGAVLKKAKKKGKGKKKADA